jgi:hypothetical protein
VISLEAKITEMKEEQLNVRVPAALKKHLKVKAGSQKLGPYIVRMLTRGSKWKEGK